MECISTISGQRRRNPKFFCCFATNVLVFTYFFWDCCWNAGIKDNNFELLLSYCLFDSSWNFKYLSIHRWQKHFITVLRYSNKTFTVIPELNNFFKNIQSHILISNSWFLIKIRKLTWSLCLQNVRDYGQEKIFCCDLVEFTIVAFASSLWLVSMTLFVCLCYFSYNWSLLAVKMWVVC